MKHFTFRLFLLFSILGMIIIFNACAPAGQHAAEKTIHDFYAQYKPGDYRVVDKTALSVELITAIEAAAAKQAADAQRLTAMGSTDKPLMIEGDIYTSLAEGATGHEIIRSTAENEVVKAEVKFSNQHYKHVWTDTVILKNEQGKWKIDDVRYTAKQGAAKSLRETLSAFLALN